MSQAVLFDLPLPPDLPAFDPNDEDDYREGKLTEWADVFEDYDEWTFDDEAEEPVTT